MPKLLPDFIDKDTEMLKVQTTCPWSQDPRTLEFKPQHRVLPHPAQSVVGDLDSALKAEHSALIPEERIS